MHYKVWPSLRFATFCVTKQLFSHKNLYGRNLQFADQTYLNEANFSEVKTSLQSNALNSTTDLNHCQIFPQQFMQKQPNVQMPCIFPDFTRDLLFDQSWRKREQVPSSAVQEVHQSLARCPKMHFYVWKSECLYILLLMYCRHWHCRLICTFLVIISMNAILLKCTIFV